MGRSLFTRIRRRTKCACTRCFRIMGTDHAGLRAGTQCESWQERRGLRLSIFPLNGDEQWSVHALSRAFSVLEAREIYDRFLPEFILSLVEGNRNDKRTHKFRSVGDNCDL